MHSASHHPDGYDDNQDGCEDDQDDQEVLGDSHAVILLGSYQTVYALIDYAVYSVEVYVCEGIDDVFIDGNPMEYKRS